MYPNGWSAILVSLDNQGMWNLRSAIWDRQYLGQQLYLRVWTPQQSFSNEYSILRNAILYSRAAGLPHLRARCRETQSIRHTTYIVSRINHSTYIAEIKKIGDRMFCCSQKLR